MIRATHPTRPGATTDAAGAAEELFADAFPEDGDDGDDAWDLGAADESTYRSASGGEAEQTNEPLDADLADALASINPESREERLLVPNYLEDTAVRHAVLEDMTAWQYAGELACYQHDALEVQLRRHNGEPLPRDLEKTLKQFGVRTLLTVRIAMGLWNLRHYDQQLCRNGSAAIRVDELLYWLGIEKHGKTVGAIRRTDGWRREEFEAVEHDLTCAATLWVRGWSRMKIRGRYKEFEVDAAYVHVSWIRRRTVDGYRRAYGVFFRPGDWLNLYQDNQIYFLAPFSRSIFELHPQNEQHALRLALYLSERWRKQAQKRAYDMPIAMQTLLRESVIPIPETNIGRFAQRIEAALDTLQRHGILGRYERCVPDEHAGRFKSNAWLAAYWQLTPPADIVDALNHAVLPRVSHGTR